MSRVPRPEIFASSGRGSVHGRHSWHGSIVRAALLLTTLLALGPFGCPDAPAQGEDKQDDEPAEPAKPEASGTDGSSTAPPPEEVKPTPPTAATVQHLDADPAKSKVLFAVSRATTGHIGKFERFTATLEYEPETNTPKSLAIVVETGSVEADRKGLTTHLQSADFLDVAKFPQARFTTTSIEHAPDERIELYIVKGVMELHGVRSELEFQASIWIDPARPEDPVTCTASLDISAKAFGIDYAGMEAELADDAVSLEIELVFPRVAG